MLVHCAAPGDCQETQLAAVDGAAGGSFTAPDSAYPAHIDIRLTVTDSNDETETKTRRIDPRTANLTLDSTPAGATVSIDGVRGHGALHEAGDRGLDPHRSRRPPSR